MDGISRGCLNGVLAGVVLFMLLAALAVIFDLVQPSAGLVLYLLVLALLLGGLFWLVRALWSEPEEEDEG